MHLKFSPSQETAGDNLTCKTAHLVEVASAAASSSGMRYTRLVQNHSGPPAHSGPPPTRLAAPSDDVEVLPQARDASGAVTTSQEQANEGVMSGSLTILAQSACSGSSADTMQLMRSRAVRAATHPQPDDACSRWERDAHWSWQVFIALCWPSFSVAVQVC